MKKTLYSIFLLSLSWLSAWAQNPLQGSTWISKSSWSKTIYTFRSNDYIYQTTRDGGEEIDTTQIQKMSYQNGIGKFVFQSDTEYDKNFYVVFFKNLTQDQVTFYYDQTPFESLEKAWELQMDAKKHSYGDRFYSEAYFETYEKRPAMPEPDKQKMLEILDLVIQKAKEAKAKGQAFSTNDFMDNWVESQGYHLQKSKESFGNAVGKYQSDSEIKSRLEILRTLE